MKIFYAVQATGNGHISRAMELLPHLQQFGKVDIFLSGDNSHLTLDAPIKYRSKGISLYYNSKGGMNYWKVMKQIKPINLWEEVRDLPVEKYDLVLNDFDFITSTACLRKKVPSIHFGHQASFQSEKTPRPKRTSLHGEWLLKKYVKATEHVGLHFKQYDNGIFPAIVKQEILNSKPGNNGHITVYLSSYCEKQLQNSFQQFPEKEFHVFSRETSVVKKVGNIIFFPVSKQLFNESFINCEAVITGGGFETPAEAFHLGKKIMLIPIKGQYEQLCNAEAAKKLGATYISCINEKFAEHFHKWMQAPAPAKIDYSNSISLCLNHIFNPYKKAKHEYISEPHFLTPEFAF